MSISARKPAKARVEVTHLELDKFGPTSLKVEPSARLVDPAVVAGAHQQRHEGSRGHGLVGLGTALVTGVGGHLHHRLDLVETNKIELHY